MAFGEDDWVLPDLFGESFDELDDAVEPPTAEGLDEAPEGRVQKVLRASGGGHLMMSYCSHGRFLLFLIHAFPARAVTAPIVKRSHHSCFSYVVDMRHSGKVM